MSASRDVHVNLAELYTAGLDLYRAGGLPRGTRTGWPCIDNLYSVGLGQWTVVTGMPNSGKSEWLDALLVNMAEADDSWLFCVYSPENHPVSTHLAKLIEKRVRKPFTQGPRPRMSEKEYAAGAAWVLERFLWLDTDLKSPEELIASALSFAQKGRKLGVVLDPWNTLDHERNGLSDTDYISQVLTHVTRMVRAANAHVWLVVHPAKIQKDRNGDRPVPTPYDLAGSAHWYNKADAIVCVHRDRTRETPEVEVHVQKVRFKHIGKCGLGILHYDVPTGRYRDPNHLVEVPL